MGDLEKKEIDEQLAEFIPDVDAREILISSYTSYINVNRSYFIADKLVDIDFYNKQLEIEEKIYKTGKLTLFGLKGIIKAEKYAPNWFFQLFHSYMPLKIQKIENR